MGQEWVVYRTENKYFLTHEKSLMLQKKLEQILSKDEYCPNTNGYMVRSLYFDSINQYDLITKIEGAQIRRKIRIRIYDPNDQWCKLEMKQKDGDVQHKISLRITREDAQKLINGEYNVLRQYFDSSSNAVTIYSIMVMGCYKPVTLIEYNRIAYTHFINNTRITFDRNVRSSESCFDIFSPEPLYSCQYDERVILEVKYNDKLLGYVSKTLQACDLNRLAISKYCMGRKSYMEYML